jgi:hypothetical protein
MSVLNLGLIVVVVASAIKFCAPNDVTLIDAKCQDTVLTDYSDPQSRTDLSELTCPQPNSNTAVIIVTDPNLSWPILKTATDYISFEDAILTNGNKIGEGFFFFDPQADRVVWNGTPATKVLISLSGADPVTLTPQRRWITLDLQSQQLIMATDTVEQAITQTAPPN